MPAVTIKHIFNIVTQAAVQHAYAFAEVIKKDSRVRWGLGAGASVLLSAGVLGIGGEIIPDFSRASGIPGAPMVQANNAIQVIDLSTTTVAEILQNLPKARRFELMLYNSGEGDLLKKGTFTVFVPASSQFDYLPKRYIASLSRQETKELALSHIVARALPIEESLNGAVPTLGGTLMEFTVDVGAQKITIGEAEVIKAYRAKNGMVYLIDRVLMGGARD